MKKIFIVTSSSQGTTFLNPDKFIGAIPDEDGYKLMFEGAVIVSIKKPDVVKALANLGFEDVSEML